MDLLSSVALQLAADMALPDVAAAIGAPESRSSLLQRQQLARPRLSLSESAFNCNASSLALASPPLGCSSDEENHLFKQTSRFSPQDPLKCVSPNCFNQDQNQPQQHSTRTIISDQTTLEASATSDSSKRQALSEDETTMLELQQLNRRRYELKMIDRHLLEMISECLGKLERSQGQQQATRASFSYSNEHRAKFEPSPELASVSSSSAPPRGDAKPQRNIFFAHAQAAPSDTGEAIDLSQPTTCNARLASSGSFNLRKSRLLHGAALSGSDSGATRCLVSRDFDASTCDDQSAKRKRAFSCTGFLDQSTYQQQQQQQPKQINAAAMATGWIQADNRMSVCNEDPYVTGSRPSDFAQQQQQPQLQQLYLNNSNCLRAPFSSSDTNQHNYPTIINNQHQNNITPSNNTGSSGGAKRTSSRALSNIDELVRGSFQLGGEANHRLVLSAHQKLIAFQCHVCGSGFEDRHRLQQHLSIHLILHPSWYEESTIKETMALYDTKRGDYWCPTCNIRLDTTAEFDKHMHLHGDKPHSCELCLADRKFVCFRYYRQLLTHLRSHCFLYKCRFVANCRQTANRKDYLKLHILKHHLNNKLPEHYTICCH